MTTYRVYMTSTASLSVEVDVPDGLDPEEARDKAIDLAYDESPRSVCANCSGWREKWSLEIGEWEPLEEQYGPAVEKKD